MMLSVFVSDESGERRVLARERLADIARAVLRAERVREAMISIALLTNREMASLNRRHLGHRGPTDVISFGFAPEGASARVVGDLYLAPAVARAHALEHGVGIREEMTRLVIHGTLHILGYDHAEDATRVDSPMWRRQEQLLARILGRGRDQ